MGTDKKCYPSIAQSWGMLGIILLSMIVFSPLSLIKLDSVASLFQFLSYVLSMGVPFLIFNYIRKKDTGETKYNFGKAPIRIFLLIILATAAIQTGITGPLASLIPMPEWIVKIFMESINVKDGFLLIMVVLAAPVLEELIFRGIILDGFLKRYSPWKAIIISSILFGIVHFNPWQFVSAALLGVFIGWIYTKTHNLLLAMFIHFVNNLIPSIMMLTSDTYKSNDYKALMNKTLVDAYGGLANTIIITSVSICVAFLCIYLLAKEFKNKDIIFPIEQSEKLLEQ